MRTSLSKHLNEYVLCRGWIGEWEDFLYNQTRRITILQPTIKKPDKQLLFKDQELISQEHHLNLYIKFEDLINYDTRFFELKEPIHFSGIVEHYQRKDGSEDFGICATKQSTLPYEVERLEKSVRGTIPKCSKDIDYLKNYASSKVLELLKVLMSSTECLPTFHQTYDDLVKRLVDLSVFIEDRLELINYLESYKPNRESRRQNKAFVNELKKYKKRVKSRYKGGF